MLLACSSRIGETSTDQCLKRDGKYLLIQLAKIAAARMGAAASRRGSGVIAGEVNYAPISAHGFAERPDGDCRLPLSPPDDSQPHATDAR
ncbi:unnamed protein product, partial [Iphiclides podalirius]